MSFLIALPGVDELLGSSIIYEEYKGDFRAAEGAARAAWEAAVAGRDPREQVDALLARGVVHVLQGEPPAANDCFDAAARLVPDDAVRQGRLSSYRYFAEQLQRNTFPDWGSAGGLAINARWDLMAGAVEETQRAEQRATIFKDLPALQLESSLLALLNQMLVPRGLRSATVDQDRQMAGQFVRILPEQFRKSAETLGAPRSVLAFSDLVAAELWHKAGDDRQAKEIADRALNIYASAGDDAGAAACHMVRGDWLVASNSSPVVWNRFVREGGQSSDIGWMWEDREFVLPGADAVATARELYAQAEMLFARAGARRGIAALNLRRCYLAACEGHYDEAMVLAATAEQTFDSVSDRLGMWLARVHRLLSHIGVAQRLDNTQTAAEAGEWGNSTGSFTFALGLGLLLAREGRRWLITDGDYERSLACFGQAAALFDALHAPTNAAQTLYDQGTTHVALGDFPAALDLYSRSLEQWRDQLSGHPSVAGMAWMGAVWAVLGVLGVHLSMRDGRGLLQASRDGRELRARTPSAPPDTFGPDQTMFQMLGMLLDEQMGIASFIGPLYVAVEQQEEGELEAASRGFEQALQVASEAGEPTRYFWTGTALAHLRRYDEAAAQLRKYFQAAPVLVAPAAPTTRTEMRDLLAAREAANVRKQAFAVFTRVKHYADAQRYLDELDRTLGSEWWANEERPWEPLGDIAELFENSGDRVQADASYRRAIEFLEERRALLRRDDLKSALLGGRSPQYLYFQAARNALAQTDASSQRGDQERAFEHARSAFAYMEAARARALVDLVAGAAREQNADEHDDPINAWFQLATQVQARRQALTSKDASAPPQATSNIAMFAERLKADEERLTELADQIAKTRPAFYSVVNPQAAVATVEDVGHVLAPRTLLMEYGFLGDDFLAIAVGPDGIVKTHHSALDARQLALDIRAFHAACLARREDLALGAHLASVFLEPFATSLAAAQHVVIVPFGAAHLLPFHALPWRGEPLTATHGVSYLPSAGVLPLLRKARGNGKQRQRVLAVGGPVRMVYHRPDGSGEPMSPLPGAILQALLVANHFPETDVLLGEDATEVAVTERLPHYSHIHLATHAVLEPAAPLLSAILLADANELSVYELMGLRLDVELVVLSACQTGQSRAIAGEDVLGLTRALLAAGARSAVVSLWPVDEMSTTILMDLYYTLLSHGTNKAESLRLAQQQLRTLTAQDVIEWCRSARDRVGSSNRTEVLARLDRTSADAHFVGRDFATALEIYTRLLATVEPGSREYRELGIASSRCRGALRDPQPLRLSYTMYDLAYYWAPFVLVGDWE